MKIKKLIALFCMVVISIQFMPVRQIGAMLFNNQITEELTHAADCGKKLPIDKSSETNLFASLHDATKMLSINGHSIYAQEDLVKQHVAEVQTPPPNLF
ncbi:MAG: hypothetical protein JST21_12725 [Bacteroidetes bacterium]|nr:hypothetical protein [Bacteroidota bacterium]